MNAEHIVAAVVIAGCFLPLIIGLAAAVFALFKGSWCAVFGHDYVQMKRRNGCRYGWNVMECRRCGMKHDTLTE